MVLTAGADGAERMLIDPSAIDPPGVTTLDGWFPSLEGGLLAYLISEGGTERPLLRVMDVRTGETVDGPIDRASRAPVAWLPGGAAFYYQRQSAPEQAGDGEGQSRRLIYLHRIGTDPGRDVLVFGQGLARAAYPFPVLSGDGRWLWVGVDWGPVRVDGYLADLRAGGTGRRFTVVQRDVDAMSFPSFGPDGRLYVLTDREAPGRRVCVVDPDHPGYGQWRTVLPEDPAAVLNDVVILDSAQLERPLLLALRSRHAVSELTLHDLATGEPIASVPAPGLGTIKELTGHPDGGPFAWFCYADYRTPPSVYRFDARSREVTLWAPSPGGAEAGAVEVRQVTSPPRTERSSGCSSCRRQERRTGRVRRSCMGTAALGTRGPRISARCGWPGWRLAACTRSRTCAGEGRRARPGTGRMRANKQNAVDDFHAAGDTWSSRAGRAGPSWACTAAPRAGCWSGPRSPSGPRPAPRCSAPPRCSTWCATSDSRPSRRPRGSTGPRATPRSSAGCSGCRRITMCGGALGTPRPCSRCSKATPGCPHCTRASWPQRCSTPRLLRLATGRSCCAANTTSGTRRARFPGRSRCGSTSSASSPGNSGSARTWTAPGGFRPGTAGSLSIRAMVSALPVRTWPVMPPDPAAAWPGVSSMNKASPGSAAGRSRAAVQMRASGLAGGIAEFVGTGTPRDHVGL